MKRTIWFLLFVAIGLLVFFVFSHYYPRFAGSADVAGRIVLGMLLLALAWGWLMQKTQSLWGSVLFHAAMDIPIAAGIFSAL